MINPTNKLQNILNVMFGHRCGFGCFLVLKIIIELNIQGDIFWISIRNNNKYEFCLKQFLVDRIPKVLPYSCVVLYIGEQQHNIPIQYIDNCIWTHTHPQLKIFDFLLLQVHFNVHVHCDLIMTHLSTVWLYYCLWFTIGNDKICFQKTITHAFCGTHNWKCTQLSG